MLRSTGLTCVLLLATACAGSDPKTDTSGQTAETGTTTTTRVADADRDGFEADVDCDDYDASVFPDADGSCDAPPGRPVFLGRAGDFAILAKAGIATVPTSVIVGDIGVSPAAASYLTGFSLVADATNVFSTSPQVVGRIFAADYAPPTPSDLTTAIGDMELAFTNVRGRSPDTTELGAGAIGGLTLAPGVYRWGTGLSIPTDVTLEGNATDVWIFQIAQDLTVGDGVRVTLAGGALPAHVFWQVSGAATLGTTSHLAGTVLSQTAVTLGTGASVDGRLLAQTAVGLDANTITAP